MLGFVAIECVNTMYSKRAGRIHAWAIASRSAETTGFCRLPCGPIHVDSLIGSDSILRRFRTAAIEQGQACRKPQAVAAEKPRANGSLGLFGPRDCSPA